MDVARFLGLDEEEFDLRSPHPPGIVESRLKGRTVPHRRLGIWGSDERLLRRDGDAWVVSARYGPRQSIHPDAVLRIEPDGDGSRVAGVVTGRGTVRPMLWSFLAVSALAWVLGVAPALWFGWRDWWVVAALATVPAAVAVGTARDAIRNRAPLRAWLEELVR